MRIDNLWTVAERGNVGGDRGEELTRPLGDAIIVCLMQFNSQKHVALIIYIKIHRSFLSPATIFRSINPPISLLLILFLSTVERWITNRSTTPLFQLKERPNGYSVHTDANHLERDT